MFPSAIVSILGLSLAPVALAAVHDIIVGGSQGILLFHPEAIFATPGDQVVFHFQQKNHSVTQSSFADPCGHKEGGFDSGFFPVGDDVTDHFPTYTITVHDSEPIWAFCNQAAGTPNTHCGKGMVFSVNCGPDGAPNSFTNFKNSALEIGASLSAAAPTETGSYGGGYGGGYGAPPAPPASTLDAAPAASTLAAAPAAAATHTVIVGGGGKLTFEPSSIKAQVNDVVTFQFQSKNHTVTQSSFAAPCQPLTSTSTTGQVGFDSGFVPVAATTTDLPSWSFTVNDTNAVWAYCKQGNHCAQGMVFAINAEDTGAKTFSAFQQAATTGEGTSSGANTPNPAQTVNGASRFGTSISSALGVVAVAFALAL